MGKGQVAALNRGGNLVLRWRYQGRRFHHSLGLPYNALNLGVAETLRRRIEADIVTGDFDPSLEKYLLPHQKRSPRKDLFESFLKRPLAPRTMGLYRAAIRRYREKFGNRLIESPGEAEGFLAWLRPQIKASTTRAYIVRLNAIWLWGWGEKLVTSNPWLRIKDLVKVPPPQPKPFDRLEVDKILGAITGKHYEDFVKFLLSTGCRMGEAAGLTWDCVSEDCRRITINATKTNSLREIHLPPNVTALLQNRRALAVSPWVFTDRSGAAVRTNNFNSRVWQPLLETAGVAYRKPGNCRHTCATHLIESGVNPVHVAGILGNSPQIVLRYYYGSLSENKLPELFGGAGEES